MHVYQMRSSNQSIVSATQTRLTTCMNALRDVSRVWLVAKMVHTLFESILGNKVLEERLQKAAGRRHAKNKGANGANAHAKTKDTTPAEMPADAQKRKFDDMELGYTNGPPAPQMSYERSRPQSPAITPSRELPPQAQSQAQHQQIPRISASSPPVRHNTDAFMGTSRPTTRPTTPMNIFSIPGTPPEFILHTRNSPKISEDLWQNYQPDQLFPPEANGMFPMQSPSQSMVDPALRGPPQQPQQYHGMPQQTTPTGLQLPMHGGMQQMGYGQDPNAWAHIQAFQGQGQPSDDQWSTSSTSGPVAPTTLNVGDWFEFFGIPNGGDLSSLNGLGGGTGVGGYG